jgi:glycosyltransferase involved in cell wall biosynthesis
MSTRPSRNVAVQNSMKLLMLSHYFDSHLGGVEFVARETFARLGKLGCQVTWAAADVTAPPQVDPPISGLPLKSWNGLEDKIGVPFPVPGPGALKELWRAIAANDVLLVHDCLYLSNIVSFALARIRRIPIIVVQHTGKLTCNNPLVNAVMAVGTAVVTRWMLRSASQVIFISGTTQHHFRSLQLKRPPLLFFNGVDPDIFSPVANQAKKAELRQGLGISVDSQVVLFVGRFVQSKGLSILEHMARNAPEIMWVLVGSGPAEPAAWGLTNVKVLSNLPQIGVADLYRASDAFVLPSLREGFPLVIQEALACGLPVICTANIMTADDALTGIVRGVHLMTGNDKGSAERFLAAVKEVLSDASGSTVAYRRFEFVTNRYSWENAAHHYFRVARQLTNSEAGSVSEEHTQQESCSAPTGVRESSR